MKTALLFYLPMILLPRLLGNRYTKSHSTDIILQKKTIDTTIVPGEYDELQLAFNSKTKLITGFYESGTGDDGKGHPQFSCIFYLEGKWIKNQAKIRTYFPLDNKDLIIGSLKKCPTNKITISLPDEHGGCSMAQPFTKEPVEFTLDRKQQWIEIHYIVANKAFFYAQDDEKTKRKGFLIKGDIVCVDKIEPGWLHCTYLTMNELHTTGWIKSDMVNHIDD